MTPAEMRYEVRPLADAEMALSGDDDPVCTDDLAEAGRLAGMAGPWGGYIIDTATGMVDVGGGFVVEADLDAHIEAHWRLE